MLESELNAVESPEYTARIKHEAEQAALQLAAQKGEYDNQRKFQSRMVSLEIAQKGIPAGKTLLEHTEDIYQWLIKEL